MNNMETQYSISPHKARLSWNECYTFGGLFKTMEDAYKFALKASNCRAFKVCEVYGKSCSATCLEVFKYGEKRIVKRSELTKGVK